MPAGYASQTGYQYDSISRVAGHRELAPPSYPSKLGGLRNNVFLTSGTKNSLSRKGSTEFARGASQFQLGFLACPARLKEAIPRPGLFDHSSLAIKTIGSPFGGTRIGQPPGFPGDPPISPPNPPFGPGF